MSRRFHNSTDSEIDRVDEYLPVVKQIAARFSRSSSARFDDLVQVGSVGLLKAIRGYDSERCKNASFRSYAMLFIKGEIRHYLRDQESLIQRPRRLSEAAVRLSSLEETLAGEFQRAPLLKELAARSGMSESEILEVRRAIDACAFTESLDGHCDETDATSLSESLPDRQQMDSIERIEMRDVLAQALKQLGVKTREIIEIVYFDELTQKEAARRIGWSEMKVSRAVKKGLVKLKEILLTDIV